MCRRTGHAANLAKPALASLGNVLIILPPSETKSRPPDSGPPLELEALSFPELNPMRERVIEALIETSAAPDAFERLRVRPTLVEQVLANTDLRTAPTRPAAEIYAGPLHAGFGWSSLDDDARLRAQRDVVVASALWGLVRPMDPIPTYRLHVCSSLVRLEDLEPYWRLTLPKVLSEVAGSSGVIVDLRSPAFRAVGKPIGMGGRTVTVRVLPEAGARTIGDVVAKRIRGEVARHLVQNPVDAEDTAELAGALSERWPIRLEPPVARNGAATMLLRPAD